ncbi:helix-turn-helix domain-containing protein [uncultured Sneathiella sp.]|uniref:helix-turn-helix transcriptional regulator n=1 Tax=uncultured Sneathiella sp. TaxID=879315 RepID=UPI0030EB8D4E|tara:strand:- start:567 stop:4640 length:4074 start_codon:yes stop_codon:yes gene_type:complete
MSSNDEKREHIGTHIRDKILKGMKVTQAAKLLGVGRPALSNLLNGNSSLSSDMAAKIEKAFGESASDLLSKQSALEAGNSVAAVNSTAIRSFVPPFAAPKANEIEQWSESLSSRATLAAFLRILIHSTCSPLERIDVPAHDDSQRPGWDGEVETSGGNPWVPVGLSGWEFGVNKEVKTKADDDFDKSVKATPNAERPNRTFVFVTPRRWRDKVKWVKDQKSKNIWKDVIVWDSSDLEQWVEQSIPAQVWFRNELGKEHRGTLSLERCWTRWNADCDPAFTINIFDEAELIAGKKLLSHLEKSETTLRIAADSTLEGLAFIYSMLSSGDQKLLSLRDRIVIFTEKGPLTELANKSARFIPVVVNRETEVELSETGVRLGGISIVPRTMVQAETDITLDTLSWKAFHNALETMGLGREAIDRYADESGRSLTVLRRRLAKNLAIKSPDWSQDAALARSVFPFMLAGAWKNDNDDDRIVLEHLFGAEGYEDIERKFGELLGKDSSPVWSIGSFRGVVSKIDALYAVHPVVTEADLKRFFEAADLVLSERDPSLDLPEKDRWAASIYNKTRKISGALREGIADSLVILAIHGPALFKNRLGFDCQLEASKLVRKLFERMTADTIESQSDELQRYAEAAPDEFLGIIERDLEKNDPTTKVLMRPVTDVVFSRNTRVGLLWALDLLAWSPKYLHRVINILAKLVEMEPDDQSGNTAMGSLRSIFRSWMPQTGADLDKRIAAFDQLVKDYPDVAWAVGKDQYDPHSRIGEYAVKPKWRDYAFGYGEVVTNGQRGKFERHCFDTALNWAALNREKLADLIGTLEILDADYTKRVWDRVLDWAKTASDEDLAWLREKIRVDVGREARRMSRKGASKQEAEEKISEAKDIYLELEPKDLIWKYAWLFKNAWVEWSWDDIREDDHDFEARDNRISMLRGDAVKEVFDKEAFPGVVRLALLGNASHLVGNKMAEILSERHEQLEFIRHVIAREDFLKDRVLQYLLDGFFFSLGAEPCIEVIEDLRAELAEEELVRLLCLCRFGENTWRAVERSIHSVIQAYWREVPANWARQSERELRYAVAKLLKANRGLAALQLVHLDLKSIESDQLCAILQAIPESAEAGKGASSLDSHYIEETFKLLNARGSIPRDKMASLEFIYLKLFRFDKGKIPNLEAEVNDNPSMFCEAISFAYLGKDEPRETEVSDERERAASNAHTFLGALSFVPGVDDDGKVDAKKLKAWISEARRISERTGHRSMLDYKIGELLAHAPMGEDDAWPCEAVREAVNDLYNSDMARGITIGRYNSRGATWRGEGGAQERELANQYEAWAVASEYDYPRMASVLRKMVENYNHEAEWQDNEAMIRRRMRF